jgi:hypothetical protein
MTRSKKTRNKLPIGGSFTPLLDAVHNSEAYKKLNGNAVKLYLRMYKVARTAALKLGCSSENDVQFNFTYSEAKRVLGFSQSTTRRCLHELWEKGLISVVRIGGVTASDKKGRLSSSYQLCGKWKTYGHQWEYRTKFEDDPWATRSEPRDNDTDRW